METSQTLNAFESHRSEKMQELVSSPAMAMLRQPSQLSRRYRLAEMLAKIDQVLVHVFGRAEDFDHQPEDRILKRRFLCEHNLRTVRCRRNFVRP